MADEAREMSKSLAKMAAEQTTKDFEEKVRESMEDGDGWLHKWCKNEPPVSPIIVNEIVVSNLPRGATYDQIVKKS